MLDMPLSMQVKLLRAIQKKEIQKVGGLTPIPVNVRFIAAAHRDLSKDVESGRFRQDLFYRLNVIALHVPALAERSGDIPLLAVHFLKKKGLEAHKDGFDIDKELIPMQPIPMFYGVSSLLIRVSAETVPSRPDMNISAVRSWSFARFAMPFLLKCRHLKVAGKIRLL
jgi:hypothetical protein